MEKETRIIAVDFDGTLCKNKWPDIGEPNLELIDILIKCKENGDKLILWTCRKDKALNDAILWCGGHGLFFNAVNENLPEVLEWMGGDSRKIYADIYLDDKSLSPITFKFAELGRNFGVEEKRPFEDTDAKIAYLAHLVYKIGYELDDNEMQSLDNIASSSDYDFDCDTDVFRY